MNTEDKIDVMQAFLDGKVIQWCMEGIDWREILFEPVWNWEENSYRIKPQKQLVIPWEHIKPEYKWAALDKHGAGEVFIYSKEPEFNDVYSIWETRIGGSCRELDALNIDTDGIDWKQSLVQRPEGV